MSDRPPLPLRIGRYFSWLTGIHESTVYGDARLMNEVEKKKLFQKNNTGICLSDKERLSLERSFEHSVTLAPTGKGKTNRFIIPNILQCVGSMIITDPAGEIFQKTSGHLHDKGYEIQVLNPLNLEQSMRFNPLPRLKTHQQLKQIALNIVHQRLGAKPDFWNVSAVELLFLVFRAQRNYLPEYNNLANTRWILNNLLNADQMNGFMAHVFREEPFVLSEYEAFIAQEEKIKSDILATARTAIDLFTDPDIIELTGTDDLNLENLRKQKTAIYLICPERKVGYYALLLNLFYFSCFEVFADIAPKANDLPIFFFMDEFGHMSIYEFDKIATTIRKRNCSLNIILQTKRQLRQHYGEDGAFSIFEGALETKIFFRSLDAESKKYLSEELGTNTVYDTQYGGVTDKAKTVQQPLMRPDEIRMMEAEEAIVITGSERPIKMRMPFYQNTELYALSRKKPFSIPHRKQRTNPLFLPLEAFLSNPEDITDSLRHKRHTSPATYRTG